MGDGSGGKKLSNTRPLGSDTLLQASAGMLNVRGLDIAAGGSGICGCKVLGKLMEGAVDLSPCGSESFDLEGW